MTRFGVAIRSGEQPKERWFSNHRPSNRGGAATSAALICNELQKTVLDKCLRIRSRGWIGFSETASPVRTDAKRWAAEPRFFSHRPARGRERDPPSRFLNAVIESCATLLNVIPAPTMTPSFLTPQNETQEETEEGSA